MSPGPIRFGHQATVSSADGPGSRLRLASIPGPHRHRISDRREEAKLFPTNRVKGRKTSRDQSHFPLARATYTVQVFNSARAVAAL